MEVIFSEAERTAVSRRCAENKDAARRRIDDIDWLAESRRLWSTSFREKTLTDETASCMAAAYPDKKCGVPVPAATALVGYLVAYPVMIADSLTGPRTRTFPFMGVLLGYAVGPPIA